MFDDFNLATTLLYTGAGLGLGFLIALFYMYKSAYNKSFVVTLVLLPAIVGAVISIVTGSVGTGIAVMGAFSLVRFRSIPGTAKEIGFIFFAMAVGLATGMGYVVYAAVLTVLVGLIAMLLFASSFGEPRQACKQLRITLPESLDYTGMFDDLFAKYTRSPMMMRVKTTNLGSLFQLTYDIVLLDEAREKEMLDQIRCRNGNLDLLCGYLMDSSDAL
jgi:hypothetical protein